MEQITWGGRTVIGLTCATNLAIGMIESMAGHIRPHISLSFEVFFIS
jgi:hypothetical protein